LNQKIIGFHIDNETHWVADLECGHAQHVRHDPPWTTREWVTTAPGRDGKLGTELNCKRCDEAARAVATEIIASSKKIFLDRYEEAGLSGLCTDGRIEAALGALDSLPLDLIFQKALKPHTLS
jgi:hypothetical protein